MAQKKLFRFSQLKTFPNSLEYPEDMAGKWSDFFKNNNPLIIELACGRGEYSMGLAKMHPGNNYIGVDVKGNRMYIGAKKALDEKINNAAFLRTQIERIDEYFAPGEVAEIWITFPDPQLRTSKAKKRLTHPRFLRMYQKILATQGKVHLKTDSPDLYRFTLIVLDMYNQQVDMKFDDAYAQTDIPELKIKTHYESLDIARSNRIHYIQFSLPHPIPDLDHDLQAYLKQTENPYYA